MERFDPKDFAILGINTDPLRDEYRRQAGEHGVTWTNAWQGSTAGPIPRRWGITSFPTMILLDREGRIIKAKVWKHELEGLIAEAIRK